MVAEDVIRVEDIHETQYGEKAVLDSHYMSKGAIKHLPWKKYEDECKEHGTLRAKAESRGVNTKTSDLYELFEEMEQYGFSNDFSTHVTWNPDALNGDGAWMIDADALDEASDFWQFIGYTVERYDE